MESVTEAVIFWPLGVYFVAVVTIVVSIISASYFLGERNRARRNIQPYESGVASTGSARVRLSADFYLFAMFFVIFDLESVFVYSWAIAARELGGAGYAGLSVFVATMVAALVYLWRVGALEAKR